MKTESLQEQTLFGHPKGLYILFFTEMWERFSYYGMRALLVFYMTKHLLFSQSRASEIYGLYTGLVYLTPIFGGILADRLWGQRRTVVAGGVLMAIGHFLMVFESLFFPALLFLIVGNGAFKPNISTQVGRLYPPGDPRRDQAFNIFYVGINLGAFFSPLVCGTLGEVYGWHYGFGAAGIGMMVGLGIYLWGQRYLKPDTLSRTAAKSTSGQEPLAGEERGRVYALIAVCLVATLFWAVAEQQGNTMALWADQDTDRHVFGWQMPATWIQSFNPFMIFLFTPLVTLLWAWQSRRGREPSSLAKIAIGIALASAACLVMVPAARIYAADGTPVSLLWVVGHFVVLTIGELFLSPVGMSLVTKLAPQRMVSMMMGVWFLTSFGGSFIAGYVGSFWEKMPKDTYFLMLAGLAGVGALAVTLMIRPLKKITG